MATSITYSDIQGGFVGIGNINADPKFVNPATNDLHLQTGSPCLGKGTYIGAPATDLDGNPRPNPPSIGAYELESVPGVITGFIISPNQIDAPGPTVKATADVAVTGNFIKVTVSPAPGNLSTASPTFTLVSNGTDWTGSIPTVYLKSAKTNPVTFVATGTRADGTTVTMSAPLQVGPLPTLTLAVSSDKSSVPAGLTFSINGFVRNLSGTAVTAATVTVPIPKYLTFVPSTGFTLNTAQNTITWTGPLATSNGSYAIHAEFMASANTHANTQIPINVTATATGFQSVTQTASIVVDAPPAPVGIDIDTSQTDGQADATAIITSSIGVSPLQAIISPVSGLQHAWLGVDYAYDPGGQPLKPTTDGSIGSLAAILGVAGPDASPTYAASFPRVGSQCNIGLRLTPISAALNVQSIALTLLSGLIGPDDDNPEQVSSEVLEFYDQFDKLEGFQDLNDQFSHPASTPWEKAFQVAYIIHDFLQINSNDIETIAAFLSKKAGKSISTKAVKKAISAVGTGRAILETHLTQRLSPF